ncbi:response regulator [Spirochaeta isovalerica]|uniref:CheY-like chemotaxis protein n=1 Tax=Spirochaeta isovalerica TaxID=150 RepID=A0A841RF83_9SPIO|nr:response regulator [Spirochaeta isovalerica]MBB6481479.1 CheY-like chemotaxis protein [Spirochaeta isovalerica]
MAYERILIVDDSATSRMIIKRCFHIAGYEKSEYAEAEDGLAALNFLKDNPVDLIVSDLNMPRMDGTTFIRRLKMKDSAAHIPVIVISSMGNDAVRDELEGTAVLSVIRKPLSPAKILEALGEGSGEGEGDEF